MLTSQQMPTIKKAVVSIAIVVDTCKSNSVTLLAYYRTSYLFDIFRYERVARRNR